MNHCWHVSIFHSIALVSATSNLTQMDATFDGYQQRCGVTSCDSSPVGLHLFVLSHLHNPVGAVMLHLEWVSRGFGAMFLRGDRHMVISIK
jgi:hypothetical protein